MKKKGFNIIYLVFVLLFTLPTLSYGQAKTITGTIVSADDNLPLPGATVVIKGTKSGSSTDFDGKYSLQANVGDVLVFSYIGYASSEAKVGAETVINMSLKPDVALLDEVVITGYGKQTGPH